MISRFITRAARPASRPTALLLLFAWPANNGALICIGLGLVVPGANCLTPVRLELHPDRIFYQTIFGSWEMRLDAVEEGIGEEKVLLRHPGMRLYPTSWSQDGRFSLSHAENTPEDFALTFKTTRDPISYP